MCEQLAQGRYVKRSGQNSNWYRSDALTTTHTPPRHSYNININISLFDVAANSWITNNDNMKDNE